MKLWQTGLMMKKLEIWEKGTPIPGFDSFVWRLDQCGAIMKWDMYGDRSNKYNCGWEIDHIRPDSGGGESIVSNARPLQWYNNASRQNGRLSCPVTWKKKETGG